MYKDKILKEYPYKIEMHAHTCNASPCSEIEPEDAVRRYSRYGYDGIVITNHFHLKLWEPTESIENIFDSYMSDYLRAKAEGEKLGIRVYFGIEIRFLENDNDYLTYGVDRDFLYKAYESLDKGVAHFSANCRNDKIYFAQAHPFRNGMERMDPSFMDGIEVFNMHINHNSRVGAAERYARENNLGMLGGTDFHHPGQEGMCSLRARTLPEDSFGIAEMLHSGDYCFEIGDSLVLL